MYYQKGYGVRHQYPLREGFENPSGNIATLPPNYNGPGGGLKVGLHVRVNFRESYREHLAMTFRRESESWPSGSLRSLLRAPELRDLSEYEVYIYA
jgi:hypothetical protein